MSKYNHKCKCEGCVRNRRMNWQCKLGFHKFKKGKYQFDHMGTKWCERCECKV